MHAPARTHARHTTEPQWMSGGPGKSAYTDYRWECGCGQRYDDARNGEVNAQHAAHLAGASPPPASGGPAVHANAPRQPLPRSRRVVGASVMLDHPHWGQRHVEILSAGRITARVIDVETGRESPFVRYDRLYV